MKNILFVCTGNLCRSPWAHYYFNFLIDQTANDSVRASSAGTHGTRGRLAPPEVIELAANEGFDLSGHEAQPLNAGLMDGAHWIVVMEKFHRHNLLLMDPRSAVKMHLLGSFTDGGRRVRDIPDPYGRHLKAYEESFKAVKKGVWGIFESLFPPIYRELKGLSESAPS